MITIYTTPSCSSCRKAKKWFDNHRIDYREKNIFNIKLTRDDIIMMLKNTDNGFEDIISTRSKVFQEQNLDIEDMSMSALTNFIIANPSVLRRPIIIEEKKMQVGYNEDEIRTFIPRRLREIIMCTTCDKGNDCDYKHALDIYFKELQEKERAGVQVA
ncbi:Regulatory protein Spx [Candidatus Izimaplasma bacterium HR1]|jgi:regulatory protein spx|uniref:transcriptional regulator Spx n=1 Tax=Candidatus Izimoplasma sp. HR1 TaxID=1541959 RepID=UPI0004F63B02|nr:Regulatory protein Spx [Candidatus Izimaplasma bacterium HR1]